MARIALAVAVVAALFALSSAGLLPSLSADVSASTSAKSDLLDPILKLLIKIKSQVIKSVGGAVGGNKLKCLNSVVSGLVKDVRIILGTTLNSAQDVVNGTLSSLTNGATLRVDGGGLLNTLFRELNENGRQMMMNCVV
ncbi:hypothetical protein AAG570_000129 [Ranatra chinensis]|uniref:Uncharacterized protein n=1 Tax=Ranatra chinensis TaxID=642074 RepID=A0ABD0Z8S9_9HEMI